MEHIEEKPVEVVSQYVAKDLLEGLEWEIYLISSLKYDYVIMASCEKLSYDIEFRVPANTIIKSLDKADLLSFYNTHNVKLIDKGKLMENIQPFGE